MARPQFYRFFTGDYLRDASHLSLLEHGAYRRLIDLYMDNAAPLPFDMPRLYRLLHATSKEEQTAIQVVIEEFFRMEGGLLRHSRCDRELEWQDAMRLAQSERAKLSWESRRKNNKLDAGAMPDHSSGNASQSQSHIKANTKPNTTPSFGRADWLVPDGVSPITWAAYLDVRKAKHAPFTRNAYELLLKRLERLCDSSGHEPEAVMAASARSNWIDLYEPKEPPATGRKREFVP